MLDGGDLMLCELKLRSTTATCDSVLAETDVMCREYVSLQLVLIPRSIELSTNGMFLLPSFKSRAISSWVKMKVLGFRVIDWEL